MTSLPGADDALGALSTDERAALAAWADEGDEPDGFADRVVAAMLAERIGDGGEGLDVDESEGDASQAAAAEPRVAAGDGRVVRVIGLIAAFAAAAAVMLMVRVLPGAPEVEVVADAGGEMRAAPVRPAAQAERLPTCDHADGGAEVPRAEPPVAETFPAPSPETVIAVLGAEAGLVLAEHCMPCHDSTDPEANPGALQVYDLEQPQWWLTMSDAQLEEARTRVQQLEAASDDERRRVSAFVEARRQQLARAG
jgi:hypothetical protein